MVKSVFGPKLPVPSPSRIETVLELKLATARSGRPSALKSSVVTEWGAVPVVKSVFAPKLPVPAPSRIETVLELEVGYRQVGATVGVEVLCGD